MKAGLTVLKLEFFFRMRPKFTWETRAGDIIPITEMSDEHLYNTIKMLERQEEYSEYDDLQCLDMNDIS